VISPKVICEKPKLPTLWLDTSVIIKLTKVERGEKLQQVEVERLTRLRTLVQELVPAGKLIFPQSDQEEEYVAKRLDPEIHRDFLGLSRHRHEASPKRFRLASSAWHGCGKIDFGIFMEQFKDVWTSLVSSHEIFASDLYLLLII
jgi:hypothetical protein